MNTLAGTSVFFFHLLFISTVCNIQEPEDMYKTVGGEAKFQWNSTISDIVSVTWGLYNIQTKIIHLKFFSVNVRAGVLPTNLSDSSYDGRVQYVGNISQRHAWFVLKNLKLSDTNVYGASIAERGQSTKLVHVNLTVTEVPTTSPPTTQPTTSTKTTPGSNITTTGTPAVPTTSPNITTTNSTTPEETTEPGDDTTTIIIIVVVVVVVLLISGGVGYYFWRKKKASHHGIRIPMTD